MPQKTLFINLWFILLRSFCSFKYVFCVTHAMYQASVRYQFTACYCYESGHFIEFLCTRTHTYVSTFLTLPGVQIYCRKDTFKGALLLSLACLRFSRLTCCLCPRFILSPSLFCRMVHSKPCEAINIITRGCWTETRTLTSVDAGSR